MKTLHTSHGKIQLWSYHYSINTFREGSTKKYENLFSFFVNMSIWVEDWISKRPSRNLKYDSISPSQILKINRNTFLCLLFDLLLNELNLFLNMSDRKFKEKSTEYQQNIIAENQKSITHVSAFNRGAPWLLSSIIFIILIGGAGLNKAPKLVEWQHCVQ